MKIKLNSVYASWLKREHGSRAFWLAKAGIRATKPGTKPRRGVERKRVR